MMVGVLSRRSGRTSTCSSSSTPPIDADFGSEEFEVQSVLLGKRKKWVVRKEEKSLGEENLSHRKTISGCGSV